MLKSFQLIIITLVLLLNLPAFSKGLGIKNNEKIVFTNGKECLNCTLQSTKIKNFFYSAPIGNDTDSWVKRYLFQEYLGGHYLQFVDATGISFSVTAQKVGKQYFSLEDPKNDFHITTNDNTTFNFAKIKLIDYERFYALLFLPKENKTAQIALMNIYSITEPSSGEILLDTRSVIQNALKVANGRLQLMNSLAQTGTALQQSQPKTIYVEHSGVVQHNGTVDVNIYDH